MFRKISLLAWLALITGGTAFADIDVRFVRSLTTEDAVRQIVTSADGQRIYLLLDDSRIQVLDSHGALQGIVEPGGDVSAISDLGSEQLILQTGDKQLQILNLQSGTQIPVGHSPVKGPEDAPVSIVIFDDFECPYCAKAVPLLSQVLKDYPSQVKLVFKNFPLRMHQNARLAAIAGLAAHRQGKFWEMHDLLFANYHGLNPETIRKLARQIGLDMLQFENDLFNPELAAMIDRDIEEGRKTDVRGTPTLFVNGRRVQKRTVEAIEAMIEEELNRSSKQEGQ